MEYLKNYKRHWVEDIRNNIGSAFLGFKISTILKQPLAKNNIWSFAWSEAHLRTRC